METPRRVCALTLFAIAITAFHLTSASPCSQDNLTKCAGVLRIFSEKQDMPFAAKKEDLVLMCPDMNNGLRCVDEFTRRCMAPQQRAHFNKLYTGSSMVIQDICQEGPYQDEYLRHAPCMWKVKKSYEHCSKDYQQKMHEMSRSMSNSSTEAERDNYVRRLCCSFQEYLACSEAIVRQTCGDETAEFTKAFLDKMSSSLIAGHCMKYPPTSQLCTEITSSAANLGRPALLLAGTLLFLMRL